MITVILFLFFLLFILLSWKNKKFFTRSISQHEQHVQQNLLPGPICIPFLGYLPLFFTRKRTYEKLAEMSADYGPIFQLKLGVRKVIVVNNLEWIKKAMNDWSFADRPDLPTMKAIQEQDGDDFHRFTFMNADCRWKFYRKNSAKALSLFSSSKNSRLQALVEQGCRSLWQDIEKNGAQGEPYYVKNSVFECVAGIIGAVNFGLNFDRNDPLMKEIVGFTERSTEFVKFASFVDYFPFCKFLLKHKLEKLQQNGQPVNKLIDQHLKNHHFDPENVGDVADALYQRKRNEKKTRKKDRTKKNKQLRENKTANINRRKENEQKRTKGKKKKRNLKQKKNKEKEKQNERKKKKNVKKLEIRKRNERKAKEIKNKKRKQEKNPTKESKRERKQTKK
uniref:Cytochrome P450 n=1 Tax=Romanomermis culicivorax TaxID=13658 RepID=A0A915HY15_ROMCU